VETLSTPYGNKTSRTVCITIILDNVRPTEIFKTQCFGNWNYFLLQVKERSTSYSAASTQSLITWCSRVVFQNCAAGKLETLDKFKLLVTFIVTQNRQEHVEWECSCRVTVWIYSREIFISNPGRDTNSPEGFHHFPQYSGHSKRAAVAQSV
jgi:hypothetical protein